MIAQDLYNLISKEIHWDEIDQDIFLNVYLPSALTRVKEKLNRFPEKFVYSKQTILKADFIANREFVLNTDLDSIEKIEYEIVNLSNGSTLNQYCETRFEKIPRTIFDEWWKWLTWFRWYVQWNKIYFRWDKIDFDNFKTDINIYYLPKVNPVPNMTSNIPFEEWLIPFIVAWVSYKYYVAENWETNPQLYNQVAIQELENYVQSIERTREPMKIQLPNYSMYTRDPWLYPNKFRNNNKTIIF